MNQQKSPLCHIVLVEPLIPENTGNIARTCVGIGAKLHLVGPLGFEINEKRVKRAGLDYWEHLIWQEHFNFESWHRQVDRPDRVFYIETTARRSLFEAEFHAGDWLVFGKETKGLPGEIIQANDARAFHLPMFGPTRSLNLSNSVAIVAFELLRQQLHRMSSPR